MPIVNALIFILSEMRANESGLMHAYWTDAYLFIYLFITLFICVFVCLFLNMMCVVSNYFNMNMILDTNAVFLKITFLNHTN